MLISFMGTAGRLSDLPRPDYLSPLVLPLLAKRGQQDDPPILREAGGDSPGCGTKTEP